MIFTKIKLIILQYYNISNLLYRISKSFKKKEKFTLKFLNVYKKTIVNIDVK